MSKNENGKYFFYSVLVIVGAALLVWAMERYTVGDIVVFTVFLATSAVSVFIMNELF